MAELPGGPLNTLITSQGYSGTNPLTDDRNPHYATDIQQSPSLSDLHFVAADIKETLSAAIADLKLDIRAVTTRVNDIEKTTAQQTAALRHINHKVNIHTTFLRDLYRHTEDLENRSRRNNLRVRGLPESVVFDRLSPAILNIFNDLLGCPPLTTIKMERLHRALRPKGKPLDPPRDVICHIDDFLLKEDILRQARLRSNIKFEGSTIFIFQDQTLHFKIDAT